jgi:hypothetical protein
MSFSGGSLNVGNLTAQFSLNAAPALSTISNVQTQTTSLRNAFNQTFNLRVDNRQAVQAIQQTTSALDVLKRGFEFGAGIAGFGLIKKAIDGIGDAMLGTNGRLQQAQVSIQALTGSAATATDMVGKLETLASHSTFGLAQLQQGAQQLLAFGVAAQNVPPLLQAIQNAAAASGGDIQDKFSRINYVIAELNSGIPISARQLRQLATAGVPLEPIAKQLGITTDALFTVGQTGVRTSEQIVAAFQKVYTEGNLGDFMQKQAGTFSGAMSLIKTNLSLATATAFRPLFETISELVVKLGQLVQTPTFNRWVMEVSRVVSEATTILRTFMSVLEPVGGAIAKVFGFSGGNISTEMAAVSSAKVDVGKYDPSLQGGSGGDSKQQMAGFKHTIDDAGLAIADLTKQLNDNKIALDENGASIQKVKDQYDPIIKKDEEAIKKINLLSPVELSRKRDELELDKQRAALELTKPDTSAFDAASSTTARRSTTCRASTPPPTTRPSRGCNPPSPASIRPPRPAASRARSRRCRTRSVHSTRTSSTARSTRSRRSSPSRRPTRRASSTR